MPDAPTAPDHARPLRAIIAAVMFLMVLAISPYTPDTAGDIKRLILHCGAFLITAAWALLILKHGVRRAGPRIFPAMWLALLAVSALAALCSAYPANSLVNFGQLLSFVLIFLAAANAYTQRRHVVSLAVTFCAATALSSLYGFCQHLGWDPFPWNKAQLSLEQYTSLPGTFGNPNLAGHALVLALILAIYLATCRGTRWCVLFAPIYLAHMSFMRHRAGLLALAAALTLTGAAWVAARRFSRPPRAAGAALLATALVGAATAIAAVGVTSIRTGHHVPMDGSLLLRYNSYYGGARMILHRPLLGFGPGNYPIENPPYWTPYEQEHYAEDKMANGHVHSEPLQMAVDAGLPAAALFLGLLFGSVYAGLVNGFSARDSEARRWGFMIAAFFVAFFVDGAFGFNFRAPVSGTMMPLMTGALVGVWRENTNNPIQSASRYRRAVTVIPVLALATANALLGVDVFISQWLIQRANDAFFYNDETAAERLYTLAGRLAPWNWEPPYKRGQVALASHNAAQAINQYQRALARDPNYIPALVGAARADFDEAIANLANANAPLTAAEDYARQTLRLCASLPTPWDVIGRASLVRASHLAAANSASRKKFLHQAEQGLTKALDLGGNNRNELYALLGNAYLLTGNFAKAEESFQRGAEMRPVDDTLWPGFYRLAQRTGNYQPLQSALETALAHATKPPGLKPESTATMELWLARVRKQGYHDISGAHNAYQKACDADPTLLDAWRKYWAFAVRYHLKDAYRKFLVAEVRRLPSTGPRAAPEMLRALAAAWGETPHGPYNASVILARLVQARGAAEPPSQREDLNWVAQRLAESAEDRPPNGPKAGNTLLNIGAILRRTGSPQQAYTMLAKAQPLLRGNDAAVCGLESAHALTSLGRAHDAVTLLRKLANTFPQRLDVRLAFAQTLAANGAAAAARFEYAAILQQFALDASDQRHIEAKLKALTKQD